MISSINSDDNNLLQLLLQASRNTSSAASSSSSSTESVNSDGDDFLSCLESNFKAADSNYDSELSEDEIDSFSKLSGANPPPMGPPPGMFIEDATTSQESSDNNSISSLISSLDKDKDGTLSLDELTAGIENTNSDSESSSDSFSDKLSNLVGNAANSDLTKNLSNFFANKVQEMYSNSSINNSSFLGSAMSKLV